MRSYESKRKNNKRQQQSIVPEIKPAPIKNIAVPIRQGLTIYTDCPSKVDMLKQKYAGK